MLPSSRLDGLRAAFSKIGLPAWFIAIDLLWVAKPEVLGVDARHYQRAATAWLAGENPWAVTEAGIPYGAGPHTLLFYAPTSWLPIGVSTALWMVVGIAASIWLVRHLGLPLWWMLFPPLTHAIWNGNPQTVMLAFLVAGTAVSGALAAAVKLYAVLPLAFHPRTARFRDPRPRSDPAALAMAGLPRWRVLGRAAAHDGVERERVEGPLAAPPDAARLVDSATSRRRVVRDSSGVSGDAVLLRVDRTPSPRRPACHRSAPRAPCATADAIRGHRSGDRPLGETAARAKGSAAASGSRSLHAGMTRRRWSRSSRHSPDSWPRSSRSRPGVLSLPWRSRDRGQRRRRFPGRPRSGDPVVSGGGRAVIASASSHASGVTSMFHLDARQRAKWRRGIPHPERRMAVVAWVVFTTSGGNPVDAWDFWVDPANPYVLGDTHNYAYSPVYAQATAPFRLVGFEAYVAVSRAIELLCCILARRPRAVPRAAPPAGCHRDQRGEHQPDPRRRDRSGLQVARPVGHRAADQADDGCRSPVVRVPAGLPVAGDRPRHDARDRGRVVRHQPGRCGPTTSGR